MGKLINMNELFSKLKEKNISIFNTMNHNNNSNNSESVKHNEFEHNLHVLIELCDQKLNINNTSKSDDNDSGYEFNDNAAVNIENDIKVMLNDENVVLSEYKCGFSNECVNTTQQNCGEKRYNCNENNCSFVSASKNSLHKHKHTQSVHSNEKCVIKDNEVNINNKTCRESGVKRWISI